MWDGSRKAEAGEQALVSKSGHGRHPLTCDFQHDEPARAVDVGVRVRAVVTEGRLVVGPRRHDLETVTPERPPLEEFGDVARTVEFERLGWHGELGIVGQERDDARESSLLNRLDEPFDDLRLVWGSRECHAL